MAQRAMDGRLAGRIDSSDVVQQTYLSAVRKFDEFNGEDADALAGWLRLIHERNLIDTARKHLEAEKRAVGREETLIEAEPLADVELTSPS
jgi:RNA polymerase sigma-70 factor (ECF subfamily)